MTLISLCRNPYDVAISFYNFFAGWFFPRDAIGLDEFVREFYCQRGEPENWTQNASYWHMLTSWFPHKNDDNVLWLHYEDLVQDLPGCVDLISKFLGIGADDAHLKSIVTNQVCPIVCICCSSWCCHCSSILDPDKPFWDQLQCVSLICAIALFSKDRIHVVPKLVTMVQQHGYHCPGNIWL